MLTLDEVRERGLPALFRDYGEALLYADDQLFDVQAGAAVLAEGPDRAPLPGAILTHGVGIGYGWRHAGDCACRFCSRWASAEAARDSSA